MDSLLVWILTISLMFTGSHCASQSMSCSTVNGKTVCESQKSDGNFAGAASSAQFGPGGAAQDASAMTGNFYTGQSSASRTSVGNVQPGGPFAGSFPFFSGAVPTFGGDSASSYSDSEHIGTGSTSITSADGSDDTDADVAHPAGGFVGFPGGFVGTSVGGFSGFGGSGAFFGGGAFPAFGTRGGVFSGNMNPQAMLGPNFPFGFVFGRR